MDTTRKMETEEVTIDEIRTLVGRYLPGGAPGAAVDERGEYVVEWRPSRLAACRYSARSKESFDEALHLLVARCAPLSRAQVSRRGYGNGK